MEQIDRASAVGCGCGRSVAPGPAGSGGTPASADKAPSLADLGPMLQLIGLLLQLVARSLCAGRGLDAGNGSTAGGDSSGDTPAAGDSPFRLQGTRLADIAIGSFGGQLRRPGG